MNFTRRKFHITTTFLIFSLVVSFNNPTSEAYNGGGKHHSGKNHKKDSKKGHRGNKKKCGENPFSTEIIYVEEDDECLIYKLKVSTSYQTCGFDLSHYMFDPGCGEIVEAYNSGNWKMELNVTDPKTEVTGLKVDDIWGFGKNSKHSSFYVKLKVCPDGSCEEDLSCAAPKVAYKAGQCIYYEEFEAECDDQTIPLEATFEKMDPTCFGSQDGSIALHINGGEKPYSISWNTGQSDSILVNLPAGEYSYTITDANGETLEHTLSLTAPEEILITEEIQHPACAGALSGIINLTVSGGAGDNTYQWNTGETTASISEKGAGTYSVEVTDVNGCVVTKTFVLESQTALIIEPYITQPSCGGESLGSIELEVMGGSEPYSFLWTDGSTEQNRYDLVEGNYQVTVEDQNGCQLTYSYVIEISSPIRISPVVNHTNCHNDPIGSIELTITGGEEPYEFDWSNGASSQNLTDLTAGKYSVDVTDANGCAASYDININIMEMVLYANQTAIPQCSGDASASVDLSIFFGEEPYTIEWSNGATTEDLEGITSGTYSVTVTDALGCTATRSIDVKDQNPIAIDYEVVVNGCAEAPEYDVTASVTGGDDNYTYMWSNGETSESTTFSEPGTYSLTVTDGNGCNQTVDVMVDGEPGTPSCLINDPGTEVQCDTDGYILNTSIDGAVSYDWDVNSADGSWVITSGSDQSEITYKSGNEGTAATFYLEVLLESGCTAICVYEVSACTPNEDNPDDNNDDGSDDGDDGDGDGSGDDTGDGDNNGDDGSDSGDDDDNGNDDGDDDSNNDDDPTDKECTDCYSTNEVEIVQNGNYFEYTITVNHNGECNFDLSHLVVSLPECTWVKDFSNSMGWKMERVYHDNKTGASGIKVDDIPSFGKGDAFTSFEIYLKLKSTDENCLETLQCFAPEIAYKSGQCVQYEQTTSICAEDEMEDDETDIVTYPNPTHDWVKICFSKEDRNRDFYIDMYDMYGKRVHHKERKSGQSDECSINLTNYKGSIFYVHVTRKDGYHKTIKVCKR